MRTIWGHEGGITSVDVDSRYLCSSSLDKSIKFWDKSFGECITTFLGHKEHVKSVKFVDFATISCGGDGIKLWDCRSGNCIRSIEGQDVNAFEFTENVIYSVNKAGDLMFHDFRNGKMIERKNFGYSIHTLHLHDDVLMFGGHNLDPIIWDLHEKKVVNDFPGHHGNIHCLHADSNILASGGSDACIKLWKW